MSTEAQVREAIQASIQELKTRQESALGDLGQAFVSVALEASERAVREARAAAEQAAEFALQARLSEAQAEADDRLARALDRARAEAADAADARARAEAAERAALLTLVEQARVQVDEDLDRSMQQLRSEVESMLASTESVLRMTAAKKWASVAGAIRQGASRAGQPDDSDPGDPAA